MPAFTVKKVQQFTTACDLLNERKEQIRCVLGFVFRIVNDGPADRKPFRGVVVTTPLVGESEADEPGSLQLVRQLNSLDFRVTMFGKVKYLLFWHEDPVAQLSRFEVLPVYAALPAFLTNIAQVFPRLEPEFAWFCELGKNVE